MRRCKTPDERLNAPRNACDDSMKICGQYGRTDSGFWWWQSNRWPCKMGLAETARQAIEKCCTA